VVSKGDGRADGEEVSPVVGENVVSMDGLAGIVPAVGKIVGSVDAVRKNGAGRMNGDVDSVDGEEVEV